MNNGAFISSLVSVSLNSCSVLANDFRNRVKVLKETKQIDLNQYNFQIDFLQMDSDENHYLSIKGIILKEQKENSNEIKYDI